MKYFAPETEKTENIPSPESIARQGNYERIRLHLKENNYLTEIIARTKTEFGERLNEPWLTEIDWEMLAVLGAFDRTTLLHSIGVYEIAKRKLQETLIGPDNIPLQLTALIESEGVSVSEFFRACLLHDIGKVEVPYEVLMNRFTENEWKERLHTAMESDDHYNILTKLNLDPTAKYTSGDIERVLRQQWLRPISLLPARLVLNETELQSTIGRGYTGEETLAEIIASHEAHSASILRDQGCFIEAELAGHHHNFNHELLRYPESTEVLKIGSVALGENAIGLLHAADVEEALMSADRPYKKPLSLLHSLSILVDHARHHQLDTRLAYSWIRSELHTTDKKTNSVDEFIMTHENTIESKQEFAYLEDINAFLAGVEHELLTLRAA